MNRDDVISYPIPMTKLARKINPKLAKLITNIIYVGALAEILGIEQTALESAVKKQFKGKASAIEVEYQRIRTGQKFLQRKSCQARPLCCGSKRYRNPQFFLEGNEAVALGALFGGAQLLSWYPITPSSSLAEGMIHGFQKYEPMTMVSLLAP